MHIDSRPLSRRLVPFCGESIQLAVVIAPFDIRQHHGWQRIGFAQAAIALFQRTVRFHFLEQMLQNNALVSDNSESLRNLSFANFAAILCAWQGFFARHKRQNILAAGQSNHLFLLYHAPRSRSCRSFAQYSSRFLILRSNPRSTGR